MKKKLLPFLVFMLPLVLLSSIFDMQNIGNPSIHNVLSRAQRMHEQVYSFFYEDNWLPSNRLIPFYRNNNCAVVDSIRMDIYNEESDEWLLGSMMYYFEYNDVGRILSNTMYVSYMDMMLPMWKQVCTYDSQNRITHTYIYSGAMTKDDTWTPENRMHFIYGPGTTFEVYSWENFEQYDKTINYYHSTFTYDNQGRIIQELGYESPDSTNWVLSNRDHYEYHPQDTTTGESFIEHTSNSFGTMMLYEGYDFPGLITSVLREDWDEEWMLSDRTTMEYDNQLRRTSSLEEYYQGTWVPDYKYLYTYNDAGQMDYSIGQTYSFDHFVNEERIDYSWEDYNTANADLTVPAAMLKVNAFPSPFTKTLTICTQSEVKAPVWLNIYNLRGQKVYSTSAPSGQNMVWDGKLHNGKEASSGIYFIRVMQGTESSSIKVIKQK